MWISNEYFEFIFEESYSRESLEPKEFQELEGLDDNDDDDNDSGSDNGNDSGSDDNDGDDCIL